MFTIGAYCRFPSKPEGRATEKKSQVKTTEKSGKISKNTAGRQNKATFGRRITAISPGTLPELKQSTKIPNTALAASMDTESLAVNETQSSPAENIEVEVEKIGDGDTQPWQTATSKTTIRKIAKAKLSVEALREKIRNSSKGIFKVIVSKLESQVVDGVSNESGAPFDGRILSLCAEIHRQFPSA